ncbi:MAG: hypothetical protein CMJ83_21865 [Planctomycetes bacterium]|jgi:hypothetical protein|nr:hypothetical protein [Planctomycetota bacterium]
MPRLRRFGWLSLLLLLRVVGPVPAGAVETTGQVKVVVADESGSKLLGARVILAGPELMGTRTVTTNYKGEVWVPNVPPGVYQVRVELADYQTTVIEEVRVTIGGTAPVDVVLKPFQAATAVEVKIARPTLDVESSSVGETLTKEFLEDVPSDRSYQRIAQFTPGVTGGSNPNVMGGASQENAWLLDGINISDPVTGTFSMNFNYDSVKEVQVLTGLYKAEYGQALGGIINVVTESGSNEFETRLGIEYENGELSPRRDAVYEPNGEEIESSEYDALDEDLSLSIATGGPIVKDRVWYHGSYSFDRTRHTEMGVEAPRLYRGHNLFAKITAMPHYAHRFTLTGLGSPATIDNQRQSNRVVPEAERRQAQGNNLFHAKWEWFLGDSAVLNTQYTHMKEYIEVTPVPCTWDDSIPWKACEDDQPEGFIDLWTPGVRGSGDAFSHENYYYWYFDDRIMDNVSSDLTLYLPDFLGTMEWKVGANLRFLKQETVYGYTGNMYYWERLETEGDPSSVVEYYWVERPGAIHSAGRGTEVAAYLQDSWKPHQRLTLDLGLRYERSIFKNDVGRTIVNTQMFLPRVSFAWSPGANQTGKIYGGFGMFGDGGRMAVSGFLDETRSGYKLYLGEYFDDDTNYSYDLYFNNPTQSEYALWPLMVAPRTYEFTVGYDQLVWEQLMVGISFSSKLFRNLWEDDEINLIWNGAGSSTIGAQSGIYDDFFRLRTPTLARRDYFGWTFRVKQNLHRNFQVDASLTYSILKGLTDDYLTISLDNPVQLPNEYGFLPADRPFVAKLAGSYRIPKVFTIGLRLYYQSGSRFDRKYLSGKSTGYDLYRLPRGSFDTLGGYGQFDLRIGRQFKLGPAGEMQAAVEILNVFNSRATTSIYQSELDQEGEIEASDRQDPFGIKFELFWSF